MSAKLWIAAAVLLMLIVLGVLGYRSWMSHDSKEETIGQSACVQSAAATGTAQIIDTAGIDQANSQILSDEVGKYDEKIRVLNAANADLAQRLHDANTKADLRGRAVPGVPKSACQLPGAGDNSEPTDRDRREAADLEACAANTVELISIRSAWQKLAAESAAKKKGAD